MAFGESSAVGSDDEGQVGVGRDVRLEAQESVDPDLACGGVEQVIASDDLGDGLPCVIDDNGELVGGEPGFGGDDEVACLLLDIAPRRGGELICERDGLIGDEEAPGGAVFDEETVGSGLLVDALPVLIGLRSVESGVAEFVIVAVRSGERCFDFFPGGGAGIDQAFIEQVLHGVLVRLEVGGLVSGAVVPVDPEPLEGVDSAEVCALLDAWSIKVFDAEKDVPVVLSCERPVDEERACVAEVESTCGRGRESCGLRVVGRFGQVGIVSV